MRRRLDQLAAHLSAHSSHGSGASSQADAAPPPTLLLHDRAFAFHFMGEHHPESPERFTGCLAALQAAYDPAAGGDAAGVQWLAQSPRVTDEQLTRVHSAEYIATLRQLLDRAAEDDVTIPLDPDTAASPGTREAVLRGSGGVCAAIDEVMAGAVTNAFCLVRSPGHHAESERAMGFCFVNNVMVGAAHALATYPTEINRVAVFDFDVHHGNGSAEQTVLRNRERSARSEPQDMLYISTHQHPYYPGTGESQTVGGVSLLPDDLKQLGVLNLPLSAASGGDSSSQQFRQAVEGSVLPALRAFKPDLLILSAGTSR